MTGVALPWRRHHRTVVSRSGKGRCRFVTSLASRGDRDVVRRFAQRRRPVMARGTARRDPCVAELRPGKRRRGLMARLAGLRRRDVRGGLASRRRPVMARRTARRDPCVAELRPGKRRRGLMARLAGLRRRDVRGGLASRRRPVMARRAARRDPCVIISVGHKHPIRRAHFVAGIARSRCRHVPSRFPPSLDTIVTSYTSACPNSHMFETRSRPSHGAMTAIASHCGLNMCSRLALGGSLVMAFRAGSRSDTVMGKKRRCPTCRPVTAAAVDRSWQVVRRLKGGHDSSAW
jgi:hypothetical protein